MEHIVLRIEHKVSNYDSWKKVFDSDPINRKKSGVKRYRIYRSADNDNDVIVELDFDDLEHADATRAALQNIFPKIEGNFILGVQLKIYNVVEANDL